MATRGQINIFIQDTPNSEPEEVYRIGIPHSAHSFHVGNDLIDHIKEIDVNLGDNVERLILRAFRYYDSDVFYGEDYIHNLIFRPYLVKPNELINLFDIVFVEVYQHEDKTFEGNFEEFKEYFKDEY